MPFLAGLIWIPFFICAISLGIIGLVFWVWMLIDCAVNEPSEGNDKIIWILIIIFAHWIGALIYLLVRRPKRMATVGH